MAFFRSLQDTVLVSESVFFFKPINCINEGVAHVLTDHFLFLFQWFLANLSYQEALSDTQVAIVNILSSTSGECS